jgi:hypothetical protein
MRNIFGWLSTGMMFTFIFSIAGCSNDLSRSNASAMIKSTAEPKTLSWIRCQTDSRTCYVGNMLYHLSEKDKEDFSRLENDGFITMKTEMKIGAAKVRLNLTDKAIPYVVSRKSIVDGIYTRIITGAINSVEVTGISKQSDMLGHKICTATYIVNYKLTPFGDILAKDETKLSEQRQAMFVLYDDGWRIDSSSL